MKAGVAVPVLAFAWIVAGALSPRADDGYRGLFCTMKGEDGHVYTVNLRVPKSGGGSCDLVDVVRVVISEPRPVHAIPTIDPNGPINWSRPDPPSPPGDLTRLPAARKLWSMFIVPREIGTFENKPGNRLSRLSVAGLPNGRRDCSQWRRHFEDT